MLNTALRTSLRDYDSIVGYVFLDVCYVLQFYREELYIFVYFGYQGISVDL